MSPSHALVSAKFRNRMDRIAPAIAFKALTQQRKRLPNIVRRLLDMAEDQDPSIALAAIKELRSWMGLDAFIAAGIKAAQEASGDGAEDEEEDRASRRKSLARKYADASPAA